MTDAFKKAYGKHWDDVKKDIYKMGWIKTSLWIKLGIKLEFTRGGFNYRRPACLDGIETNNSWKKIESFQDLPQENGPYWVVVDGIILARNYNDNTLNLWKEVTHYIKINEPNPPIY